MTPPFIIPPLREVFPNSGGIPTTLHFPFTYDMKGLAYGVPIYTPAVGDLLLLAWISVLTAWNGTTPSAQIGTFTAGTAGLVGSAQNMASADGALQADSPDLTVNSTFGGLLGINPGAAAQVAKAVPIKVVVSQTGAADGSDPGATQGSAILYIVTVTPA